MTDPTTALRDLDLIAALITRALNLLDTGVSPACEGMRDPGRRRPARDHLCRRRPPHRPGHDGRRDRHRRRRDR